MYYGKHGHKHDRKHEHKHVHKCEHEHKREHDHKHDRKCELKCEHKSEQSDSGGIIFLEPIQGSPNGGNLIIINGYNLIYTASVTMGGISVPFSILSNNKIQIIAQPQLQSQSVPIMVYFRNGLSETLLYTYVSDPIITILNPSIGPITGNNIITILGSGLALTKSVYFGSIPTFNFVVTSNTTIQVVVPNLTGQANMLEVRVEVSSGSSNKLMYTLIPPPMI